MIGTCAKLSHEFSSSVSFTLCENLNPTAVVYRHFCLLFSAEIGNKSSKTCMIILTLRTLHSFSEVQMIKAKVVWKLYLQIEECQPILRNQ